MDYSHTCLKKVYVEEFHYHQNSVKPNIQFTKKVEEDSRLFFWTPQLPECMERYNRVYNEKNIDKQTNVDYNSHHPLQHKRSLVDTHRNRAGQIPSTETERSRERGREREVLFVAHQKVEATLLATFLATTTLLTYIRTSFASSDLVVISYVRDVSEKISRMLRNKNVKVGFKPLNVLHARFPRHKDPTLQSRGVVYKIECLDCDFRLLWINR